MATQAAQSGGGSEKVNGGIVIGVRGADIPADSPISSGVNGLFGDLEHGLEDLALGGSR